MVPPRDLSVISVSELHFESEKVQQIFEGDDPDQLISIDDHEPSEARLVHLGQGL